MTDFVEVPRVSVARRPKARRRDLLWGVASAAVVLVIVGMVFGNWSSPALAMTISASRASGPGEIVYGNVAGGGKKRLAGITVTASHTERRHEVVDAVTNLDGSGDYRIELATRSGSETVTIAGRGGHPTGHVSFHIHPGMAFRVSARIVQRFALFFFPIFSY